MINHLFVRSFVRMLFVTPGSKIRTAVSFRRDAALLASNWKRREQTPGNFTLVKSDVKQNPLQERISGLGRAGGRNSDEVMHIK